MSRACENREKCSGWTEKLAFADVKCSNVLLGEVYLCLREDS